MEDLRDTVEKAKSGDSEAFGRLYNSCYTPIYRYLFVRIKRREDAEDLAQEVFVKAFGAFNTFTLRGSSVLPFFYTIARNTLIDFRRKKHLPESGEEVENVPAPQSEIPDKEAMRREDRAALFSLLADLSDNERDSIIMRFVDGFSNKEIGDVIGRSAEAVRQLQSRGLRKMRSIADSTQLQL